MAREWRFGASLGAAALALTLGACGGSDPVQVCTPPKVGTPPNCSCPSGTLEPDCRADCTTPTVYQDSGGIPAESVVYDDFSVPDSGRLDVTLDWTNASSPVGFYLVPANTCATVEEFNARSCNFLVRSEPSTTKPRKISTPNFSAGNYRWLIANYSDADESVSFQVVLSKGTGCAPLTGGSPSASERDDAALPPIERFQHR
jgi:hypothetical protein